MSEQPKLGHLIFNDNEQRDAIHVAIAPVTAAERLHPGERINFVRGSTTHVEASPDAIGVVDPFLARAVEPEQRFFMCLFPGTIASLRHEWTHPRMPTATASVDARMAEAITFIEQVAHRAGLDYDEVMAAAEDYLVSGVYLCQGGRWEGFDFPLEFWDWYAIVTGENVPEDDRGSFFSCSC